MKKNLITVAFFVASLAASAQTQNARITQPVNPFPFQTDALKQEWINANPNAYVNMGGDKPIIPTTATGATPEFTKQADKDAWLAQQEANAMFAKQAPINANNTPPEFTKQADKEAWLAAHGSATAASTIPQFATEADKDAWLEAQNASQVQAELNAKLQFISDNGIIIEPVTP